VRFLHQLEYFVIIFLSVWNGGPPSFDNYYCYLMGGQLVGIFGMLLAVPTASIIKVTAQELHWGFKNYRMF